MGWRSLAVLLLIAAGLVALLYWTDPGDAKRQEALAVRPLGEHRMAEASKVKIRSQPRTTPLELAPQPDGAWWLVEPLRDLAAVGVLEELRQIYETAQLIPFEAPGLDRAWLEEHGLEPALAEIEFTFATEKITVGIGTETVLGGERFVRFRDKVYRGSQALHSALQKNVDDARSPSVFQGGAVTELRLQRRLAAVGNDRMVLKQIGQQWRIVEPIDARASADAVDKTLRILLGMRIERHLQGNFGMTTLPDAVIELVTPMHTEKAEFWFEPGAVMKGYHHGRELMFTLDPANYDLWFQQPAANLRSHILLPGPVEQLVRIQVERKGAETWCVERTSSIGYALTKPAQMPVHPTALNELMAAMHSCFAMHFVDTSADPASMGFGPDALRLELVDQFAARPVTLEFGASSDGLTYVRRSDEPWVVLVKQEVLEVLRRPFEILVGFDALALNVTSDVLRIRVQRDAREVLYQRDADLRWHRGQEQESLAFVTDAIEALRNAPKPIRVHDARRSPAAESRATVTLMRMSGDELETFDIVQMGQATCLAVPQKLPGLLFELSPRDARDLRALVDLPPP